MEEAAKEKGKDVDIVAYPFTEMERVIEGVDVAPVSYTHLEYVRNHI